MRAHDGRRRARDGAQPRRATRRRARPRTGHRPRLLLADEPSSGLDTDEALRLADIISRVRAETGLAVLLVEHDLTTVAAVAERVVALDAGRVIAEGTFDEVVRDPQVIESWLGRPA